MQKANGHPLEAGSHSFVGARFQVCFTPLPGFFSPFPRGTSPLSVIAECLALGGGPPCFGLGFTCPALLGIPPGGGAAPATGLSPCAAGPSRPFACPPAVPGGGPTTPGRVRPGLGSAAFARRYLRYHCCFLLLGVLRCFTSPGVASPAYAFGRGWRPAKGAGFPHSGTPGSKRACRSPGTIAACRALPRLAMPRHPPCARMRLAGSSPALALTLQLFYSQTLLLSKI